MVEAFVEFKRAMLRKRTTMAPRGRRSGRLK